MNPTLEKLQKLADCTRNIILYGVPGTGKTYCSEKFAEIFLHKKFRKKLFRSLELVDFMNVVFYVKQNFDGSGQMTKYLDLQDILKMQVVQEYFKYSSRLKYLHNLNLEMIENEIEKNLMCKVRPTLDIFDEQGNPNVYLFQKNEQSQWSLTYQGVDRIEKDYEDNEDLHKKSLIIAREIFQHHTGFYENICRDKYVFFVTFHQSFSYEDFIEGIKPRFDKRGNITYRVVDGIFKKLCKKARADLEVHDYILIIDEINRANIAKVFGELITLLEDDKRGEVYVTLPYSQESFTVPKNLYIIGTMNTADRSIALLDIALRRRFAFVEVLPDPNLLEPVDGIDLPRLLKTLNQKITNTLGRDYQIGHSYFLELKTREALEFAWYYRVIPLLQEYYYSDSETLQKILGEFIISENNDSGGSNYRSIPAYRINELTGEDFRRAIEKLYRSPTI